MTLAELDRGLRALADPTRVRLTALLLEGECCVSDLVETLGLPQPTVSRHLATLREAGLVAVEREGAWAFYRLGRVEAEGPRGLLGWLESRVGEVPELRADRRRLRELRRRGGCCPSATRARRRGETVEAR